MKKLLISALLSGLSMTVGAEPVNLQCSGTFMIPIHRDSFLYVRRPGVVKPTVNYESNLIVLTFRNHEETYTITDNTPTVIKASFPERSLTLSRTSGELYVYKSKDGYPVFSGTCTKAVPQF